jgi:acyl dehydratase
MSRYRVQAYNTATESENKIHDDTVASNLGFAGGLVPGVDVYAYLCHLPAERWGLSWLERGTMRARFIAPVYDGDEVEVTAADGENGAIALSLRDSRGDVCAEASASVSSETPHQPESLPLAQLPAERPPASAAALDAIGALGSLEVGYHADRCDDYLDDVREHLALFRGEGYVHPAWLLRQANYILSRNVRLGPWIHVSSDVQHLGLVRDGDRVSVRGRVRETYERKGHKFVDLDVQWIASAPSVELDERVVMVALHTAIFEPRGSARATA